MSCATLALIALTLAADPVPAPAAGSAANSPNVHPHAREVLALACNYLASKPRFRFDAQINFEVVQPNGERLEFDETETVHVRRPDKIHTFVLRDGKAREAWYDGQQVTIVHHDDDVYGASGRRPPSTRPWTSCNTSWASTSRWPTSSTPTRAHGTKGGGITGRHVGTRVVDGRTCHHIA